MQKYVEPKVILGVFLIFSLLIAGCTTTGNVNAATKGVEVTLYKSATCGCCVGYAAEMEARGYNVTTVNSVDMDGIKQQYTVPSNMESCHTAVIGGYFVEGHVPFEAVEKLLTEKPAIDGIALPNMPAESPGMPGVKKGPFVVYAITNGQSTVFMEV